MSNGESNDSGRDKQSPPNYENYMFSASGEFSTNNAAIVERLDSLEVEVEQLRSSASGLEEQRDMLTKTLTEVAESSNKSALTAGHREEIETNINRLMQRLLTVNIKVEIPRTEDQEKAYQKVKSLLNTLQNKVNSGLDGYKRILESYLNACSSEQSGPVDATFQQVILACTIDDQKQVKKILKHWIQTFHELHEKWLDTCKNNIKLL